MRGSGVSRRNFLRAVGITGGAGTMFATMGALGLAPTKAQAATQPFSAPRAADFSLTGRAPASVVILGGGVAGLVSAYELGKAGYKCTIIEPRSRTGGRNFTARNGTTQTDTFGRTQVCEFSEGQYVNCGPARLAQWMVTLDYCRELGVPIQVFSNQNADAYLYNASSGMTAPERWRTAKSDVYGYVAELLAKATSQGALDSELTSDDKARLMSFLEGWGSLTSTPGGYAYTGSTSRGYSTYPAGPGQPGVEYPGPPSLPDVFASQVGKYFSFEFSSDMAMMMFQPVGGMDQIPQALTRAVGPEKIMLGAQATGVTDNGDDVTVTYTDATGRTRTITADYAIAAMPPWFIAGLNGNLGPGVQTALAAVKPSYASKIGLEYKSRWWETDYHLYGGVTDTDLDLNVIWTPSHDYHGERGVIVGYYNYGSAADLYGQMPPVRREQRAIELGSQIFGPKYRTEFVSSFSQSWHYIPHLEAAWHSGPAPDAPVLKPLVDPTGRVYYAGDWLSYMDAWQHGAISSAREVVSKLNARVLSG
ncbi:MAG TPA: FAD-dependent oxidoreductase [Streptosporangiaceae bacterium]